MNIGIIGCGAISNQYMIGLNKHNNDIEVTACADIDKNKADQFSKEYNTKTLSVDELILSDEIDIVVNLTPPLSHFEISYKSLKNAKHVFSEKPIALTIDEGKKLFSTMKENNVYLYSAPDTFLGPAFKKAQELLSSNKIGKIIGGSANFTSHGVEGWHPNPEFYYKNGGGPLFDMGPYYLTALVKALGPVQEVIGYSKKTFDKRNVENPEVNYKEINVDVDTHYFGLLKFKSGIIVDFQVTFDIWKPYDPKLEIYGDKSSLKLADPNNYDGEIFIFDKDLYQWELIYSSTDSQNNFYRGLGVVNMVKAIKNNTVSEDELSVPFHILEVMCSLDSYNLDSGWKKISQHTNSIIFHQFITLTWMVNQREKFIWNLNLSIGGLKTIQESLRMMVVMMI